MGEIMNNRANSQEVRGRYRALIGFIALFVLTIISVLLLNFIVSSQFEDDAAEINMAGQQRMLSQRMIKTLQNILIAQQSSQSVTPHLIELRETFEQFDITLYAFDTGGEIRDSDNQLVYLNAVSIPDGRDAIEETKLIWKDYGLAIQGILKADGVAIQSISDANASLDKGADALFAALSAAQRSQSEAEPEFELDDNIRYQLLLTQQIVNSLFKIEQAQLTNSSITQPIKELTQQVNLFDTNLSDMLAGIELTGSDGTTRSADPVTNAQTADFLLQASELWQPMKKTLDRVTEADTSGLISLTQAIAFASTNNLRLLGLMDSLAAALENDSARRSDTLRLIQIIGIAFALLMFAIIVFYFLSQLRRTDVQLNRARRETDRILDTVNDGLFLMDKEHTIGNQYSGSLVNILNEEQPAGQNFLTLLRKIVPEKTLQTAEDYIELLLGDRVNEELVTDLNPLDEIEVFFDSGGGEHLARHLSFGFKRVIVDDQISHLLVKVDDVTDRVTLERDLMLSQQKSQAQFDLMIQVLHVDPTLLTRFLGDSESSLAEINDVLSQRSITPRQHASKVGEIFRISHGIKGDAASLGLEVFEEKAHEFEDILEEIRDKDHITGKDFLPLTIKLDEFLNQIESLRTLILRLGQLQKSIKITNSFEADKASEQNKSLPAGQFQSILGQLAQKVAIETDKRVQFRIEGESLIPDEYRSECNDILIQLIRNSIVHGIEDSAQRNANQKPAEGQLNVTVTEVEGNNIQIDYHDDGRGLSVEAIKLAARNKGLVNDEQLDSLLPKQIVGLIFKSGFSTVEKSDRNAGRGVGMDVVASKVRALGGTIGVKSVPGHFCEFIIRLPKPESSYHIDREAV